MMDDEHAAILAVGLSLLAVRLTLLQAELQQ